MKVFSQARISKMRKKIDRIGRATLEEYRSYLCDFVMIGDITVEEAIFLLGYFADKAIDGDPSVAGIK